jgi:hypothetical protein
VEIYPPAILGISQAGPSTILNKVHFEIKKDISIALNLKSRKVLSAHQFVAWCLSIKMERIVDQPPSITLQFNEATTFSLGIFRDA